MRIATWNVNGLRARLDFVLLWLKERQPDAVGLQELKGTEEQFPFDELKQAGYHAAIHAQKAWNGVAILTRRPAEVTQAGLPGQGDFGARLITADVDGLSFTTVYVPNGKSVSHDDYPRKLEWLAALDAHFRDRHDPAGKTVLCGDFNVCPQPLDSWNEAKLNGSIFHTDAERAAMGRFTEWGFRDLFRDLHPDEAAFSWWDYRGGAFHRKMGLRIDLLLATGAVKAASVMIDRDWRKKHDGLTPSDHAPVIAEIE